MRGQDLIKQTWLHQICPNPLICTSLFSWLTLEFVLTFPMFAIKNHLVHLVCVYPEMTNKVTFVCFVTGCCSTSKCLLVVISLSETGHFPGEALINILPDGEVQ